MKRVHTKIPGYDCLNVPCKHERKGNHGIGGGYWIYAVTDDRGDLALVLSIHASDYPETVPERASYANARAESAHEGFGPTSDLSFHATFPTAIEECESPGHAGCEFLNGAACFNVWTTALQGGELWKASGQPWQAEPTEALWLALEAKFLKLAPGLRAENTRERWRKCPTCAGSDHPGFVEMKSEGSTIEAIAAAAYAGWAVGQDIVGPMHVLRDSLPIGMVKAAIEADAKKWAKEKGQP